MLDGKGRIFRRIPYNAGSFSCMVYTFRMSRDSRVMQAWLMPHDGITRGLLRGDFTDLIGRHLNTCQTELENMQWTLVKNPK